MFSPKCETYYIQPFFKGFVSRCKKPTTSRSNPWEILSAIEEDFWDWEEIEQLQSNVGGVVKNLSFLSTSL
jgi:hypothetical protein